MSDESTEIPPHLRALTRLGQDRRIGGPVWRQTWILLAALLLLVPIHCLVAAPLTTRVSLFEVHESDRLLEWLAAVTMSSVLVCGEFLLLGGLVGSVLGRNRRAGHQSEGLRVLLLSGALGLGLAFAVCLLTGGVTLALGPAAAGSLLGVWCCWLWRRGRTARFWLALQLALLLLVAGAGPLWAATQVVEDAPLRFTPTQVTSREKRELVDAIQASRTPDSQTRRLLLSERHVDLLAARGLAALSDKHKARVRFREDTAMLAASLALPGREPRYLNLRATGRLKVENGRLVLRFAELQMGRLELPAVLRGALSYLLVDAILRDQDLGPMIRSIRLLEIRPAEMHLVAQRGVVDRHIAPLLAKLGSGRDLTGPTRVYLDHLVSVAPQLPRDGEGRFRGFVQAAFKLAVERSQSHDIRDENRAAIYALGILLGHSRLEQFVGNVSDTQLRQAMRKCRGRVTVRNRADWVRHYWVSAGLALVSSGNVSDAVGLLKEELDAGQGGSGFSFGDLLADRAGTVLGSAATRDKESAQTLQQHLAGDWRLDEIFPPAADLPEGIPDSELQRRYGGVDGPEYRTVVNEIERRLALTFAARLIAPVPPGSRSSLL